MHIFAEIQSILSGALYFLFFEIKRAKKKVMPLIQWMLRSSNWKENSKNGQFLRLYPVMCVPKWLEIFFVTQPWRSNQLISRKWDKNGINMHSYMLNIDCSQSFRPNRPDFGKKSKIYRRQNSGDLVEKEVKKWGFQAWQIEKCLEPEKLL